MIKNILKKIIVYTLTMQARLVLFKYKPKIIAVSGSVGKTGTKDAIFDIVNTDFFVRKSQKSYNSEFGVPLTILGVSTGWSNSLIWIKNIFEGFSLIFLKNHYPKWLVLEVGTDRPGDMKSLSKWLKPDIVVVTRIGDIPAHIEFFASTKDVLKEEVHLVKALKKDGLLVLNSDDEKVCTLSQKTKSKITTYGFGKAARMRGVHTQIKYKKDGTPAGIFFKIEHEQNTIPATLNSVVGEHRVHNILAALAVGSFLKINMIDMVEAIENHKPTKGRMRLIKGLHDSTIIDDSYNSSPVAVAAALDTLADIKTKGRRIAVLGDMLELGEHTTEEHKKIGKIAGGVCCMLISVGQRARCFAEGALSAKLSKDAIIQFSDSKTAGRYLKSIISKGDVVLVKGSQGVRMENTVQEIMDYSQKRKDILVRQEQAWKYK